MTWKRAMSAPNVTGWPAEAFALIETLGELRVPGSSPGRLTISPTTPYLGRTKLLDISRNHFHYRPSILETGRKRLTKKKAELLQGTLDLLILKTLSLEPRHGLGISRRIQQITRGAFEVMPGSLFPALHRLEQEGWIEEATVQTKEHNRAKYYQLTPAGREQLRAVIEKWEQATLAIGLVLKANS